MIAIPLLCCLFFKSVNASLLVSQTQPEDEIYKEIPSHKGTIMLEKMKLYSSSSYVRVRLDIPLQHWITRETELIEAKAILHHEVEFNVHIKTLTADLDNTIQRINLQEILQELKGHIQPTLIFFPEETLADPMKRTNQYDTETKTYYLSTPCKHLQPIASLAETEGAIELLSESIRQLRTEEQGAGRRKRQATVKPGGGATPQPDAQAAKQATNSEQPKGEEPPAATTVQPEMNDTQPETISLETQPVTTLSHIVQNLQITLDDLDDTILQISQGKFPNECVSNEQWELLIKTIVPKEPKMEKVKEEYL